MDDYQDRFKIRDIYLHLTLVTFYVTINNKITKLINPKIELLNYDLELKDKINYIIYEKLYKIYVSHLRWGGHGYKFKKALCHFIALG